MAVIIRPFFVNCNEFKIQQGVASGYVIDGYVKDGENRNGAKNHISGNYTERFKYTYYESLNKNIVE